MKIKTLNLIFVFIGMLFNQEVFEGYTLFTPGEAFPTNSYTIFLHYLLDNDQSDFHSWRHVKAPASMPYLIPGDRKWG